MSVWMCLDALIAASFQASVCCYFAKLTAVQHKLLWHRKDQKELRNFLWAETVCFLCSTVPALFISAATHHLLQPFTCSQYRYNNSQDISHQFSATVNFKLTRDVWFFTRLLVFLISPCKMSRSIDACLGIIMKLWGVIAQITKLVMLLSVCTQLLCILLLKDAFGDFLVGSLCQWDQCEH